MWQNDRRTEIVTAGTDKIRSYDLGRQAAVGAQGDVDRIAIPTPFAADGLLYITSGYPADTLRPAYAIRPGATGDISLKPDQTSNDFIVWSQSDRSDRTTRRRSSIRAATTRCSIAAS